MRVEVPLGATDVALAVRLVIVGGPLPATREIETSVVWFATTVPEPLPALKPVAATEIV